MKNLFMSMKSVVLPLKADVNSYGEIARDGKMYRPLALRSHMVFTTSGTSLVTSRVAGVVSHHAAPAAVCQLTAVRQSADCGPAIY